MHVLGAFIAGLLVATVTTPAGVSGAVLLLPIQVSVLGVHESLGHANEPDLQPPRNSQRRAPSIAACNAVRSSPLSLCGCWREPCRA